MDKQIILKENVNDEILFLLKNRNPFFLNSLEQLRDKGGTRKQCICGNILYVDTTNSKDSPCYTSPICMVTHNSNGNIYYNKRHNKNLHKILIS